MTINSNANGTVTTASLVFAARQAARDSSTKIPSCLLAQNERLLCFLMVLIGTAFRRAMAFQGCLRIEQAFMV